MLATMQTPSSFLTATSFKLPQGKWHLETGMRFSKQRRIPELISPVVMTACRAKGRGLYGKRVARNGVILVLGSGFNGSGTVGINFTERFIQDPVSRIRIECKGMPGDALKRGTAGNHFF